MRSAIRPMQAADLPAILAVQAHAYAGAGFHPEPAEVYGNRMALAPDCCLVALADGRLQGYLLSHPWDEGLPPPLHVLLARLPTPGSCWYLHDCAVSSEAQGRGLAMQLHAAGIAAARRRGLRQAALVAVADAVPYWLRLGYARRELPGLAAKLAGYGAGAQFLGRPVE